MATRKNIESAPAAKKVATKTTAKAVHTPVGKAKDETAAKNVASGETIGDVLEQAPSTSVNLGLHHGDGDAAIEVDSEKEVTVVVPFAYDLTLETGKPIRYEVGTQEMPLSHATHWYSRARGVTIYKSK